MCNFFYGWGVSVSEIESYLYVDLTKARSGDIATLTSPIIQSEAPICIHIDYRLKGNVQLDVSYKADDTSLEKHRVCALVADDMEAWNSTDIVLPSVGVPFKLFFDALILSPKYGGVDLDNITVLDANCSFSVFEGRYISAYQFISKQTHKTNKQTKLHIIL